MRRILDTYTCTCVHVYVSKWMCKYAQGTIIAYMYKLESLGQ